MVTVVGYSENVVCVNDPRVQQSPWRYKKDEFERARWSQTVIQYLFLDRAPIDVLEEYYQKPPFHPSLPLLLILIDKGQVRVVLRMIGMFEGRGH